ncbi:hypothetical protein [Paenibacillus lautus]|uniref:hypothetical protein n=1 Tax=Paenibacillus lautus TaxID=1401 RepID=UPI003D28E249
MELFVKKTGGIIIFNKKLPLAQPPIRGYQFLAYQLSVICISQNHQPWLHSHFIQLYGNPNDPLISFYEPYIWYDSNPWFEFDKLSTETIKQSNIELDELIMSYIDRDYYIMSIVDEFHLPNRRSYQKFNYIHDLLIYGYSRDENKYTTIGFDEHGTFKTQNVDYSTFKESIFNTSGNFILPFKLKQDYKPEFRITAVVDLLNDYLHSINTSERIKPIDDRQYHPDHVFGIKTYELLKNYFELLIENKVEFDIRSLHFLCEHKESMIARINFLIENGFLLQEPNDKLISEYQNLKDNCIIARNLQLKYLLNNNKNEILKVIEKIDEISKMEEILLTKLLNQIKTEKICAL